MRKNLVMYFYISDTKVIDVNSLLHLNFLKKYKDVFDGQKIIHIATDRFIENKQEISELFDFLGDVDFNFVINDPENRESKIFIDQLYRLDNSDSITFYCHNKGTTGNGDSGSLINWITSMYFMNLDSDYLTNVEQNLIDKTFYGTLRKDVECSPWVCSDWHYSGTFFWFNTKKVISSDLSFYKSGRFSVESFPGQISNISESVCDYRFCYDYNFDARTTYFWDEFFNKLTSDEISKFNKVRSLVDGDLTKIANYLGSDKGTIVDEKHSYTCVYESLFTILRKKDINLLEIGIKDPRFPYASVKIWDLYFERANIIGLDYVDSYDLMEIIPNFEFIQFNQYDIESHLNILNNLKSRGIYFDIIIDDGPHSFDAQINSLNLFYELVKVGGYYIIEDLHCDQRILEHIKSSGKYSYKTFCNEKLVVITKESDDHQKIVNNRKDYLYEVKKRLPLNPKCMEIGVQYGDFSKQIFEILNPDKLYLIDPFENLVDPITKNEYYSTFNHKTVYSDDLCLASVMDKLGTAVNEGFVIIDKNLSTDAVRNYTDDYLDFIYIDACHIYDAVLWDLENYISKLKPGGIMAGHDYGDPLFGVTQAVDEFCLKYNYQITLLNTGTMPGGDWALSPKCEYSQSRIDII